jgi:NAD(P)-dependent dehydrogenase (short-subunit alcohol dehydrogenase family)
MSMPEQNDVALVTGTSSGFGLLASVALAEAGFRVFATMRDPNKSGPLREAARLAGVETRIEVLPLDVTDAAGITATVDAIQARAGRIDVLVNNAGYTLIGSAEETSLQEAKELFDTNFFGVLRVIQAVLPIMRQQQSGRISIIGSAVGFLPAPYQGIYAASKHALEGYAESLDHEVRQFGIRVAVIEPGFIRTNIAANSQLAARHVEAYAGDRDRVLTAVRESVATGEDPVRVALVVLRALTRRSPRVRYPAGWQATLLSRVRKFAPRGIFERGLRKRFRLNAA